MCTRLLNVKPGSQASACVAGSAGRGISACGSYGVNRVSSENAGVLLPGTWEWTFFGSRFFAEDKDEVMKAGPNPERLVSL